MPKSAAATPAQSEPAPGLTLSPELQAAVTAVNRALDERARVDRALADRRAALPDLAALSAEADRLARSAEADAALAAADIALGGTPVLPPPADVAGEAQRALTAAREEAATTGRTITELERRARQADQDIAAAAGALKTAGTIYASGEAKALWREEYLATVREMVRLYERAHYLGNVLAGDWRLYQIEGVRLPEPGQAHPLMSDETGAMRVSTNLGDRPTTAEAVGTLPELFAPIVEAKARLAAHRPYAPPAPPSEPYVRRGYDGPWDVQHSPADRAHGRASRFGHLDRR